MHRLILIFVLGLLSIENSAFAAGVRVSRGPALPLTGISRAPASRVPTGITEASGVVDAAELRLSPGPRCGLNALMIAGGGCAVRDLDGDRLPDSAFRIDTGWRNSSAAAVMIRLSASGRDAWIQLPEQLRGMQLSARDIDGDDDVDLVLTRVFHRRPSAVLVNDGRGDFSLASSEPDDADGEGPALDSGVRTSAHARADAVLTGGDVLQPPTRRAVGMTVLPASDRGLPAVPRKTLYCRLCRTRAP